MNSWRLGRADGHSAGVSAQGRAGRPSSTATADGGRSAETPLSGTARAALHRPRRRLQSAPPLLNLLADASRVAHRLDGLGLAGRPGRRQRDASCRGGGDSSRSPRCRGVSLPASLLTADPPPSPLPDAANQTNDGVRSFVYDPENRLTSVFVPGAWRSDFGMTAWDGGAPRPISPGRPPGPGRVWPLPLRRPSGDPGARQQQRAPGHLHAGAGFQRHARGGGRHRRPAGDVPSRDQRVAALLLPRGRLGQCDGAVRRPGDDAGPLPLRPVRPPVAQWGPMAGGNTMQFSSMPAHAASGLSLYPFRAYDPGFQSG